MPEPVEQRILVTQAEPGMVLARSVTTSTKVALCSAGAELTPSVIEQFLVRGVKRIYVKGCPLPDYGKDEYEVMITKLRARFRYVNTIPRMVVIQTMVENALVRYRE